MMVRMLATPRGQARRARGRRSVALLLVAAVAWLSTGAGCSGDDDPQDPDRPETESVPLELTLGAGSSQLDPAVSDEFQTEVADTLTGYVVSAFLGEYPRSDFVEALDWFTTDGAELAAARLDHLTGKAFEDADSVTATRLVARLAPFAPEQEPAGVSAAVEFSFDVTEDGATSTVTLTGRLMMVPEADGWRIFGFKVSRDDLPGEAAS
jgi:hypothetical protein